MAATMELKTDKLKDVADVPRVDRVEDVIMRAFSHKYVRLSEMQKRDAIDYLCWLENPDNRSF